MLNRIFHSPLTAYVLVLIFAVVGQLRLNDGQRHDIHRNCMTTQNEWDTLQHVIGAATNPPARRGTVITRSQRAALHSYQQTLIDSIGARPTC